MKERELRENADCDYCNKPIGTSGIPAFHTVEVVSYRLDQAALQRQQGFGMMIGAPLAMAMGADEDLAVEFERSKSTMCWTCWAEKLPEASTDEKAADE